MPAWAVPSSPPADASDELPAEQPGEEVHFSARFGTGGFGFFGIHQPLPGSLIRGGLGIRFGVFEMDALGDAGLMLDRISGFGDEYQPMVRFALNIGLMGTVDIVGFHAGARASIGYAEARADFGAPPGFDPFNPDPGDFLFEQGGILLGLGGYFAVSLLLQEGMRLFLRAELEAAALTAVSDTSLAPTVSVMLAVE